MPNPLTGDFEAVLQVSGSTVNRLLASMHQNAFTDPKTPSFPHSVRMRLGDDHAFEGVRGVVHAQIGVPQVELYHGVTDRFHLALGVRAWFRADPGTKPMATYIHGTVHADYRLRDIPSNCLGYAHTAAGFLWVRVVRDSVRFLGTAEDEQGFADLVVVGSGVRSCRLHRAGHPADRPAPGAPFPGGAPPGGEALPARVDAQPQRADRRRGGRGAARLSGHPVGQIATVPTT